MDVNISENSKITYTKILGRNIERNQNFHLVIKAGSWFSMTSNGDYSLLGCTVSPGFNYEDFEKLFLNTKPKLDNHQNIFSPKK